MVPVYQTAVDLTEARNKSPLSLLSSMYVHVDAVLIA